MVGGRAGRRGRGAPPRARRMGAVLLAVVALLAGCGTPDPGAGSSSPSTGRTPPGSTPPRSTSPGSTPPGSTPPGSTPPSGTQPPGTAAPAGSPGPARAALDELAVRGRAPLTGYDRDRFGQAWADADRNGCDTRNDILRRDLREVVLDPRTGGCVVLRGLLTDPYSGQLIAFQRGPVTSAAVQVDHVVSLADAWQKGAQRWPPAKRVAFANDPLNLLAVDGALNQAKGGADAATWLPPDRAAWCAYAARQVAVKRTYELSVTAAELAALAGILDRCADQPLPSSGAPTRAPIPPGSAADPWPGGPVVPPQATGPARPAAPGAPGLDPRFDSCQAALAAGLGPYVRGVDPEYAWYLDGDADGTVCEPPR